MIPLFILWLIRNYRNTRKAACKPSQKMALVLLIGLFFCRAVDGQVRSAEYDILHNGELKGTLVLCEKTDGGRVHITIQTEVKTRVFFWIVVKSVEEAVFENGNLIYSSLYRQVNGEEKVNQQLQSSGRSYQLISKENITGLPEYPIRFCILSLYCHEPVDVRQVYSDNYHQYVNIKRVGQNKYQVNLPNGNSNYYCYKNGICTRVEIDQLYHLEFRLK